MKESELREMEVLWDVFTSTRLVGDYTEREAFVNTVSLAVREARAAAFEEAAHKVHERSEAAANVIGNPADWGTDKAWRRVEQAIREEMISVRDQIRALAAREREVGT